MDTCSKCNRRLQENAAAEISGLCDHCREVVVLERTGLANAAFAQVIAETKKTGTVKDKLKKFFTTDPDTCNCGACGDWQDELDRWEQHG